MRALLCFAASARRRDAGDAGDAGDVGDGEPRDIEAVVSVFDARASDSDALCENGDGDARLSDASEASEASEAGDASADFVSSTTSKKGTWRWRYSCSRIVSNRFGGGERRSMTLAVAARTASWSVVGAHAAATSASHADATSSIASRASASFVSRGARLFLAVSSAPAPLRAPTLRVN